MDQRLYAFWRYDGYPTKQCLGGPVKELLKDGIVVPETYGGNHRFKSFKLCLLEEGIQIQHKLDELDAAYCSELEALKNKYSKLHDKILKVPK